MKKPIVVFGAGAFAEVLHFYFTHDSDYTVAGFTVDRDYLHDSRLLGLPVVPFDEVHNHFPPEQFGMSLAIGYPKTAVYSHIMATRKRVYEASLRKGYDMVSYISSKAMICQRELIGKGVIILEGVTLMPLAKVGSNVVLNPNTMLSHHSRIDDHVFVAGVYTSIGSSTVIEENCFIGVGATVGNGLTIGKESIIGLGAIVKHDVAERSVLRPWRSARLLDISSSNM